jgi:parallel beta-helix repeat protein
LWGKDAIINSVQASSATNAIDTADGVVIEGLSFNKGLLDTSRGIAIKGNDVVIRDCSFYKIDRCVNFFTCSNVLITGNYFYQTGYAMINESATNLVINGVIISNNIAYNINQDMILFNTNSESYSGLVANNITVTGNVCNGVGDISDARTECRFCSVIHGSNFTITGNAVYKTAGDSAIHLEGQQTGTGSDVDDSITITGNTMRDCVSNYSRFIWPISTGTRHIIIADNVFEVTSATRTIGGSDFIRYIDNYTKGQITITGNIFRYRRDEGDTTTTYGAAISEAFNPGSIVSNNQFINLGYGFSSARLDTTYPSTVEGNRFVGCYYGILLDNLGRVNISNNVFIGSTQYDLYFVTDTVATKIYDNYFTSIDKSINNKLYVDLTSCYNNTNANFGKNQNLINVNKATNYALGRIGLGTNNILISSLSEYNPNSIHFWADLTSILGRTGNYNTVSLNSYQGDTKVTGVTYTITSGVLYIQCAADGTVNAGQINFVVEIY